MTNASRPENTDTSGSATLWAGGLAALLASACCLGPLVLLLIGVSGSWIAHLTRFEPYQPFFTAAAVLALGLAWRRVWRPATTCRPGEVCALPRVRASYRILFVVVAALLLLATAFPLIAPWFY